MKPIELKHGLIRDISKACNVTHSAVSQWFAGATKPSIKNIFIMEDEFGIPARAWLDIKSYLNNNTSNTETSRTNESKNLPKAEKC